MRAFAPGAVATDVVSGRHRAPHQLQAPGTPVLSAHTESQLLQRKTNCACGGGCPNCGNDSDDLKIQTKLAISQPGDVYEQEADRVAEQVMRLPEPMVQKQCTNCSDASAPSPNDEEKPRIQRLANGEGGSGEVATDFTRHLGAGAPLDAASRTYFEPRFGHDFGNVRIHANNHLAPRLQARAFTIGSDIYFAPGEFRPNISSGQRIIAHELIHTIQQGAVPALGARRADRSASISRAPTAIQREVGESSVASSSQVLSRIGARMGQADAHAAVVVRVLRALNSRIPAIPGAPAE